MGKIGCSINGNLNEAKFSEPMPWIGLYVAAASLVCGLAMAADLIHGFKNRKLWFPSRFFSFNATSLTIITVAVKLSVDLNTPMPSKIDQLAKLSSGVLICIVMGNSMPSLGTMETEDLMMNVIALVILVITVIVNIGIQLGTGVIYVYWREHGFIMFLMLVMLLVICFSALIVPTTKKHLEMKYKKRYDMALREEPDETCKPADKKLREDLMKFWMMAHTSSPQFVMGRSATCTASGALCLLSAAILAEAMLRTYLIPGSFKFCTGVSDYNWSSILILSVQTAAVAVGTIGPAIRWFGAVHFRCPMLGKKVCRKMFKVEKYWIQSLTEMKACPLAIRIEHRNCKKLCHDARNKLLDMCIVTQTGIVLMCKAIQLVSVYFVSHVLLVCKKLRFKHSSVFEEPGSDSQKSLAIDLSRFVLHLEGEDELVELMMRNNRDATEHWINKGRKKEPKRLIELVEKSTFSEGFKGVREFDSDLIAPLDIEDPPNCWSLPIVTLTAIAIALPNVEEDACQQLICAVHDGFKYVRLIEDNLDRGDLINVKRSASVVWLGLDLYQKWLDVDLRKLSSQSESPKDLLEGLAAIAKHKFVEFKQANMAQCPGEKPSSWPVKLLAANSMYRISKTVLHTYESKMDMTDERLFDALTVMISDIICACLTNLKRVIFMKCLNSTIEEREGSIRQSVFLLGKAEKILKLLDSMAPHGLDAEEMASIDQWRKLQKPADHLGYYPSSGTTSMGFPISNDLSLNIV